MERLNEELAIVATLDAIASSTTTTTDEVDMDMFDRVMFILDIGAVTGTTDFEVISGKNTGSLTNTVASITQLGSTDDNKQAIIEVDGSALPAQHHLVAGKVTSSAAGNNFAVIALGGRARYHPASDSDLASVAEIVNG